MAVPPTSFSLRQKIRRSLQLGLLLALPWATASSKAAVFTWEGDVDGNWNTNTAGNTNWISNGLPALSGDSLIFGVAGSSGSTLVNDIAGLSISGLTFNAGASAYTMSGQALTLAGPLINNSANLQTLNFGLNLSAVSSIQAVNGAVTIGGLITSTASDLTLSGSQTLSLTGGLNFSSTSNKLTSTATDLRISGAVAMSADVLVSGGTTRFVSGTQAYANGLKVDGASSVISFEGAAVTVNGIGGGGSAEADSLSIANGGTLNVSAGTLDVTPSRLWMQTGTLNVTGGTLSINNALIAQATAAVSNINVSAGTLSIGNGIRLANNGTANLTVSGTGAVTMAVGAYGLSENGTANLVMNGGTMNITSSGTSYLFLNGGNTAGANTAVTSSVSLNGGLLSTRGFAINTGANATNRLAEIRFNGGTLRATDNNGTGNFIPSSANLKSIVKSGGAIIDTNGFNITIADILEHDTTLGATADGGLVKNGTGTLTLNAANTYTGTTTLNAGATVFTNAAGGIATYAGQIIGNGGTMTVSGANTVNFAGGFNLSNVVSTLTVTSTDARINGNSTFDAMVTASGGGVLKFQSGTQTLTKGLVASGTGSTLSFEGATVNHNGNGDGNANNGLLLENGGILNVSAGIVTFGNNARAFIQTSTINVTGGSLVLNNALFSQLPATVSEVNVSGGSLTLGGATRFANNGTSTLTVSSTGAVTWARGSYGISENGSGNIVMNGGTLNMTSSGSAYFYLNGGNQAAFNTAIVSSISLNAGVLSTRGFEMNTTANATNRLAEIRFNGGTLRATDNNGPNNFIPDSANLASIVKSGGAIIDTNGFNIIYADALEHDATLGATLDGGLNKIGTGRLTLTNAVTYTGRTLVSNGTLALSSAVSNNLIATSGILEIGSGAILDVTGISAAGGFQVLNGQRLSGSGSITGSVTLKQGQIRPGNNGGAGDGTLTFSNNLTFDPTSAGTVATLTLQGTTTSNETGDLIHVLGALTLNSNSQIVVTPGDTWTPMMEQSWTLMDWAGLLTLNGWNTGTNLRDGSGDTGSFLDLPDISGIGFWNISNLNTGSLVITIVPEPSRCLLLGLAVTFMGFRRRRVPA